MPSLALGQEFAPVIEENHPLLLAAKKGDREATLDQLQQGVSINSCTNKGNTAIRSALEGGHLDLARELMTHGFEPTLVYRSFWSSNELVEIGTSTLSLAAKTGAEDMVDKLLADGLTGYPKFFGEEDSVDRPVLAAIKADQSGILRKLLASSDPAIVRKRWLDTSYTCLTQAKSVPVINILIEYGVDVNAKAPQSPPNIPFPNVLYTYAQRGWKEGVVTILAHGADPTQADTKGVLPAKVAATTEIKTLLKIAVLHTHVERARDDSLAPSRRVRFPTEIVELLLNESEDSAIAAVRGLSVAELNATDDRGWTTLNYALNESARKLAHALVDAGADVCRFTTFGSPMIVFAVSTGDVALVKKIVAKGADVDAGENGASPALIIATEARDRDMVEALLSLGASPEPPRPDDPSVRWQNALMYAVKAGDIPLMDRLLRAGGDVSAVDSSGENIVFYAVRSGKLEVLEWTLNHGAYLQLKTRRGTNALTLAASLNNLEMVKALLARGLSHPDAESYADNNAAYETAAYLRSLKATLDPNQPEQFWQRENLTVDEVRHYLDQGNDMNYAKTEYTPLQRMVDAHNIEAVTFLLERGANPHKRGSLINYPVFSSFYSFNASQEDQSLRLLQLFLDHGVSPNAQDGVAGLDSRHEKPVGDTLLTTAIRLGRLKCARYLLERGADPSLRSEATQANAFDALRAAKRLTEAERYDMGQLMKECAARIQAAASKTPSPAPVKF